MEHNTFSYTYSAPENTEVLNIRKKYLPKEESKLEELKRLDQLVQNAGIVPALCLGILSCLVFGLGMCLAMQVIGQLPWLGVIVGLVGAVGMIFAYPIHRKLLGKAKAQHAPRILQLADELSGQNQ